VDAHKPKPLGRTGRELGVYPVRLVDGSTLTFRGDGSPLARTMNGNQLFAEAAADGELTQVVDGVEQRLPADPGAVFGGVSGHDALVARQQVRMAGQVHARKVAAAGPAVVRRLPTSRPAARRPGAKRTRSRAGPSSDDDPPGEAGPPPRRPENLAEQREFAASRLALADARSPSPALWERVRNVADRRTEELRRRG